MRREQLTQPQDLSGGPSLSPGRRRLILAICCLSLLIVGLDVTIVNVALPSIGRQLHTTVSGLQWTVDAYTLVLASLLMLSGSTADRWGRRRTFQIGLLLFTVGSLLCSLAPSLQLLVAFRMVQAVGGSMLNPVAMSIITTTFTDRRERAQAIGIWGGVVGISMALGPVVGGALVNSVGWRAIFWINIPIGLAAIVLTALYVPESKARHARRVDPLGQGLIIILLAALTFAIIEGRTSGWNSATILGSFLLAMIALLGLMYHEPRRREPLIDLRFFRSVPFAGASAIAISAFAALGGFLFLNTLYLQELRGFSALEAGALTLPMAVMTMVFAPISGRVVGRRGSRVPLVVAGVAVTASSLMLSTEAAGTSLLWLMAAYVIFGLGFGLVNAPITNTAVSGMPLAQAGVAAAIASTSRQIGASLGVAVVGAMATVAVSGSIRAQFGQGSGVAWWTIAGCGLLVLVIGVATTSVWAQTTARKTASLLMPPGEGGTASA